MNRTEYDSELSISDVQGVGLGAFVELSADALHVWDEFIDEFVADESPASVSVGRFFGAVASAAEVEEESVDGEVSEKDDKSDGGIGIGSIASVAYRVLTPRGLRMVISTLTALGSAALFGFFIYQFFKYFRKAMVSLKDGSLLSSVSGLLSPSSYAAGGYAYEDAVGEALYAKMTGQKYTRTDRGVISTRFGVKDRLHEHGHSGVDLVIDYGTPLKAPEGGVVTWVGGDAKKDAGGLQMKVRLDSGVTIGMAHLSRNDLWEPGQRIEEGQVMAYSGNSGSHTTGAHLHLTATYEKQPNVKVNPLEALAYTVRMEVPIESYSPSEGYGQESMVSVVGAAGSGIVKGEKSRLAQESNNLVGLQGTRKSGWKGQTGTVKYSQGREFVEFERPEDSLRALVRILLTYQNRNYEETGGRFITLRTFGQRYVTGTLTDKAYYSGDDVPRYYRDLSTLTGYGLDERLDVTQPEVAERMIRAVARLESGSVVSEAAAARVVRGAFEEKGIAYNRQPFSFFGNFQR